MIEQYREELKDYYDNYINKNEINKSLLNDNYFKLYLDIIKLFSKNPWITQKEVFNSLKISNKNDLITINKIIRSSDLAQEIITKLGIGKKYWNTIIPFAKSTEKTISNQYTFPQRIALFPGVSCMFYCGFCGRDQSQKYPMSILNDSKKTFDKLMMSFVNYYESMVELDDNLINNQHIDLMSKLVALQGFLEKHNFNYRIVDFHNVLRLRNEKVNLWKHPINEMLDDKKLFF